jgi:hypothetical protein
MSYNKITSAFCIIVFNACAGYSSRDFFMSSIYDYLAIWSFIVAIACSIITIIMDDETFKQIVIFNVSAILNWPMFIYMMYSIHTYMNSYFIDFVLVLYTALYIIGYIITNNQFNTNRELEIIRRNRMLSELNEKILKTAEIEKY